MIELIIASVDGCAEYWANRIADYLLDNGVVLPVRCGECKNYDAEIAWCKIHSCFIDSNGDFCHPWENHDWKMFDGSYFCSDGERRENNGT